MDFSNPWKVLESIEWMFRCRFIESLAWIFSLAWTVWMLIFSCLPYCSLSEMLNHFLRVAQIFLWTFQWDFWCSLKDDRLWELWLSTDVFCNFHNSAPGTITNRFAAGAKRFGWRFANCTNFTFAHFDSKTNQQFLHLKLSDMWKNGWKRRHSYEKKNCQGANFV